MSESILEPYTTEYRFHYVCPGDRDELPVVKTTFDPFKISVANLDTVVVVIVPMEPNPELYVDGTFFRQPETGRLRWLVTDANYPKLNEYAMKDVESWDVVRTDRSYLRPRTLCQPWGAYLVPKGLEPGSLVYVEDVIGDVLLLKDSWDIPHIAGDGVAIWNGETLEFQKSYWEDERGWIVG